jgi:hypothetical protein
MRPGPHLRGWLPTALLVGAWLGSAAAVHAVAEQASVLLRTDQPGMTTVETSPW